MTDDETALNLENPEQIVDETVTGLDAIHASLVVAATRIRHLRDAVRHTHPQWPAYGTTSEDAFKSLRLCFTETEMALIYKDQYLKIPRRELH